MHIYTPQKLTWNPQKLVVCRCLGGIFKFHVSFRGCNVWQHAKCLVVKFESWASTAHTCICYIFVYVKHLPSFAHFFSCQPKRACPPFWQLVQFGESHKSNPGAYWERNFQKSLQPPPPAKYCWVIIPSYNSFFVWLLYLCTYIYIYIHTHILYTYIHTYTCMYMYIYDLYSGNNLAVPIQAYTGWIWVTHPMTGGSKPVAEAWKTCVHVKRSYSWLAPKGPGSPSEGHVFWWLVHTG